MRYSVGPFCGRPARLGSLAYISIWEAAGYIYLYIFCLFVDIFSLVRFVTMMIWQKVTQNMHYGVPFLLTVRIRSRIASAIQKGFAEFGFRLVYELFYALSWCVAILISQWFGAKLTEKNICVLRDCIATILYTHYVEEGILLRIVVKEK